MKVLVFGVLLALLPQANVMGQLGFNIAAPHPLSDTFLLESLPGANHTIYLDFDGHVGMEIDDATGEPSIYTPYNFEGSPVGYNACRCESADAFIR